MASRAHPKARATIKSMRRDPHLSRKGFTLIEILVVIGITMMLASLTLTYSKVGERQVALYVETQHIANFIFRAKSLSLATYIGSTPNRCGYGVEINYALKKYILFAYQEPNPPACASLSSIPAAFRVAIESFSMDPKIVLKNSSSDSLREVLFVPPDPKVLLSTDDGSTLTDQPTTIYLETIDGGAKRTITVSASGRVDF